MTYYKKKQSSLSFCKIAGCFFIVLLLCLTLTLPAYSINPLDWIRNLSRPKRKKYKSSQTAVAAVRGITDPSQVNPKARNYEAVDWMESRRYSPEIITEFVEMGKLKATVK